jgi:hypothetical protein
MQLMDAGMGTIGLVIFGADSLLYFLFRHINEVDKSPILHNMATNMSKVSVFRGAERGACASLAYALVGIAAAVGSLTPAEMRITCGHIPGRALSGNGPAVEPGGHQRLG